MGNPQDFENLKNFRKNSQNSYKNSYTLEEPSSPLKTNPRSIYKKINTGKNLKKIGNESPLSKKKIGTSNSIGRSAREIKLKKLRKISNSSLPRITKKELNTINTEPFSIGGNSGKNNGGL